MSRAAVEQLLYLMDEAFEGEGEHSLLSNLRSVKPAEWSRRPRGGTRTIGQIAGHVGACKYMYDNHAFGDAKMTWDDAAPGLSASIEEMQTAEAMPGGEPGPEEVLAWLREGHRRLREHVAALDDGELLRPRRANWGAIEETRWIVRVMIEHDLYHAGEINHIRALLQVSDRWAWLPAEPS